MTGTTKKINSTAQAAGLLEVGKTYTFDVYGRLKDDLVKEDIIENKTDADIATNIIGSVRSIKCDIACKVIY